MGGMTLGANVTARRLVTAAAVGGGGLGLAGAVLTGVVHRQAAMARRTIPAAATAPPACTGRYGAEHAGPPLRMVMLGDSSAAGYGVAAPRHTPGALLAVGLVEQLRRPVELACFAAVGAESAGLARQVERALHHLREPARPAPTGAVASGAVASGAVTSGAVTSGIAVILVGGNDLTHRVPVATAVAHLAEAVRALRAAGVEVVVGTCPDLGTIRVFRPPLRWVARRGSRRLAAAQTVAVVRAGGRTVSLGDLIAPAFYSEPDRMFSHDRFHPSEEGYAVAAAAILPTLLAALDEAGRPGTPPSGVRGLPRAAVEAVRHAGTEVSATPTTGDGGRRDRRWAQLRRRVWRRTEHPTDPTGPAGPAGPPGAPPGATAPEAVWRPAGAPAVDR